MSLLAKKIFTYGICLIALMSFDTSKVEAMNVGPGETLPLLQNLANGYINQVSIKKAFEDTAAMIIQAFAYYNESAAFSAWVESDIYKDIDKLVHKIRHQIRCEYANNKKSIPDRVQQLEEQIFDTDYRKILKTLDEEKTQLCEAIKPFVAEKRRSACLKESKRFVLMLAAIIAVYFLVRGAHTK